MRRRVAGDEAFERNDRCNEKEPPSTLRKIDFEALGGVPVASRKPSRKQNYRKALGQACDSARERNKRRGDPKAWEGAEPGDVIGLYAFFHETVYGVFPEELEQDFLAARSSADRAARDLGSIERLVAMLRWRFAKERLKVEENGGSEFRIGWRLMFSKKMVVDFKVARPSK